jgi:hypothetical protein
VADVSASRIDIAKLQRDLQTAFDDYDAAVESGADDRCRTARKLVMDPVRAEIERAANGWAQGIYLFAEDAKDVDGLIYIGCAHRGDLRRRLEQYLIRDVSSMDLRMYGRTIEERSAVADRRLAAAMPRTADDTRASFVQGHLRSLRLAFGGSLFIASSTGGPSTVGAEGMLISTAWSLGACLENRKCEWPLPHARVEGRDLALSTVQAWQSAGLSAQLASLWIEALSRLCVGQ